MDFSSVAGDIGEFSIIIMEQRNLQLQLIQMEYILDA